MNLSIFTDGACKGNPGQMGIGIVIKKDNKIIKKISKQIGFGTNNIAEMTAIKIALENARLLNATDVQINSDSQLSVRFIKKEYKCKKTHLMHILNGIFDLIGCFNSFSINWIKRQENTMADELANIGCEK